MSALLSKFKRSLLPGMGMAGRGVLFTVLMLFALTLVIYPLSALYAESTVVTRFGATLSNAARQINGQMISLIDAKVDVLTVQAKLMALSGRSLDDPVSRAQVLSFQQAIDGLSWVGVADREGRLVYGTAEWLTGESVRGKRWFIKGLNADYISDLLPGSGARGSDARADGQAIELAVPIRDGKLSTVGVLVATIRPEWLRAKLADFATNLGLPDDYEFGVFGNERAGVLGNLRAGTFSRLQAARQAAGGRPRWVSFPGPDGDAWIGTLMVAGEPGSGAEGGWSYVLAVPRASLGEELAEARSTLFSGIVIPLWGLGLGCLAMVLFYATRLQRFLASIRHLDTNQSEPRELRGMPDELVRLRGGLASLLAGLRRRERELQRAYEELAESFRGVSSSFPGMFCSGMLSAGKPAYTYLSASSEKYLGVPAKWILQDGNFFLTNIPAHDRGKFVQTMADAFRGDGPHSVTFRVTGSDGELRWLRMVITVRYDRDGRKYFDAIGIDISPIMEAEDQAAEAYREAEKLRIQAEQANLAKSTFLANMSHELRTPLNGIIGFATLIEEQVEEAPVREKARNVREMGEMLRVILNDILDYSKIEAGRLQLERQRFSLTDELRSLSDIFRMQAMQKGLAFRADIPDAIPHVVGDPLRLRQVMLNLVSNAVKFTDEGTVELAVGVRVLDHGVHARFEVRDTGIGISPESQRRLFERFVQADSMTPRLYGGTGLGLAISKSLVTLMGGEIGVVSTPGKGSTFWVEVELPLPRDEIMPLLSGPVAVDPAQPIAPLDVLVVDDFPLNRKLIVDILRRDEHRVTEAADGLDALRQVGRQIPDLILMDVDMPNMDGYEATRRIRELSLAHHQIRIYAMTGNAFPEDVARALDAGMDGHLAKPIQIDQLRALIGQTPLRAPSPEPSAETADDPAPTPANAPLETP